MPLHARFYKTPIDLLKDRLLRRIAELMGSLLSHSAPRQTGKIGYFKRPLPDLVRPDDQQPVLRNMLEDTRVVPFPV